MDQPYYCAEAFSPITAAGAAHSAMTCGEPQPRAEPHRPSQLADCHVIQRSALTRFRYPLTSASRSRPLRALQPSSGSVAIAFRSSVRHEHRRPSSDLERMTFMRPN